MSIVQGLVITAGILFAYQYSVRGGANEEQTRAMVFTTLIFANILLSLTNRSFYYSLFASFKNRNVLFVVINGLTLVLLLAILYYPPLSHFFRVTGLGLNELGIAALVASVSVLWFEVYKLFKRKR